MNINETRIPVKGRRESPDIGRLMETIESKMTDTVEAEINMKSGTPNADGRESEEVLYIPFLLGNTRFAVPLADTLEVGQSMSVTPLPNLPAWVRGIGNIRGEVISVVDLKVFFGSDQDTGRTEEYIIVLNDGHMKTGVIVDRLMGVKALDKSDSQIIDTPYPDGDITTYIDGVIIDDEGIINVLDTHSLLGAERMNAFR